MSQRIHSSSSISETHFPTTNRPSTEVVFQTLNFMASPSAAQLLSLASSSSSSSSNKRWTYDVFLSFRGKDTRKSFTDHLYAALDRQGIFTFRDDEQLERGKPISSKLLQAIEESMIALVVFSKNYASSTWCLDEIATIVKCMKELGQIVLPIFYDVDPSEVRKQTGSFAEAFDAHEERFKNSLNKVQRWRTSLTEVANLSGFHLQDRHESNFIQEIIEKILSDWIRTLPTVSKDLVGISSRVKKMMKLCASIEKENDVDFIGIWGMSGIGKTTLARAFYDEISPQFEARSFLENVREVSKRGGITALQDNLLFDLQMKSETKGRDVHRGISEISHRLRHKKVFIVLDDVDNVEQLEALAGSRKWFGPGSRIIITTRDKQVLIAYGVGKILEAKELKNYEAVKLFSWKVFKNDHPPEEYMELSHDFVHYVKGHPLAINILARLLCGKSVIEWKCAFRSLKSNLEGEIMSTLMIGFDGLSDPHKQMFLDIACFFKGMDISYVAKILESFGFNPVFGIGVLIRKSLITLVGRKLWMHDLLQEMGWEIVRQECPKEPSNCSRLWHLDDVVDVLMYNKGTDAVEGIVLNLPPEVKVKLNNDAFSKMKKLRYLRITDVLLPQDLNYLSTELRVIEWHGYPSKLLPQNFPSSKLVQLNMCCSHIKHLWKGMKALDKLKYIDLSDSESLIETPDFTGAPNLESLIYEGCSKLSKVHPSISILKKLILLNLRNCKSLKRLPSNISLESLETAILSGCARLKIFPDIVGDMECLSKLYLDGTAIEELPLSIKRATGLTLLDLSDCKNLLRLPSAVSCLTHLKTISLSGCSILHEIPENIGAVECLEELDISGTSIRQIPSSIVYLKNLKMLSCSNCRGMPSTSLIFHLFPALCPATGLLLPSSFSGLNSLMELSLDNCNLLDGAIPNDLHHLSSLKCLWLSGNNFTSIPETICRLSKLSELSVRNCKHLQLLPELPVSLKVIFAAGCTSLKSDSDQYEVWPVSVKGRLRIIKRSRSPMCWIEISERQFVSWLQRYHQDTLRIAHGFSFSGANIIPKWFNHQSSNSSISVQLPTGRPWWIAYTLYVDFVVLGDFDIGNDFKLMHKFDCFYNTKNGPHHKHTLSHELIVKDVPVGLSSGYWISIPHLWFSQQLIDLNECSSIETHTRADSAAGVVKMSGARLLYQQDFEGFVQAIKCDTSAFRIRKNKKGHSGGEIKSTLKEQGGEFTSIYSDSSRTHLSISVEDQGCKIDSTISLSELLESLPLRCYEGRWYSGIKYYVIKGKFTNPQSAITLEKIIQEYSGQHDIVYKYNFLQSEIPESFCCVKGSSATFALNASLDSTIGWKGIAFCVSVAVHRHPSLILDDLFSENPYIIHGRLENNTGWKTKMHSKITKSEAFGLKRVGLIWVCYRSRGSFSDGMLNGCTSMHVRFHPNSDDLTILSCGHQVVFHQNADELVETIMLCSRKQHNNEDDDDEEDDILYMMDIIAPV